MLGKCWGGVSSCCEGVGRLAVFEVAGRSWDVRGVALMTTTLLFTSQKSSKCASSQPRVGERQFVDDLGRVGFTKRVCAGHTMQPHT